ncbi:MAG: hypothetical protein U5J63_16030 [Fodinibius sp.]|nr:hypothetical protein [Fodinibius sp.]
MAHWLNNEYFEDEVIPENTLNKPPSVRSSARIEKMPISLPPYEVLDPILEAYIEDQCSNQDIAARGFDLETVERITALVDYNEFKRNQAVPGLKVSDKAFGTGRRWPIVHQWTNNRK